MKKWWQRWKYIDIGLLGIAIILSLSYLFFSRNLFPETSPFSSLRDLWLNISTDLIVVWLSVRIIDNLLHSYEKRTLIRQRLVNSFNYFLRTSLTLAPHYDGWKVQEMIVEMTRFEQQFPKRFPKHKHLLEEDELQDISVATNSVKELIEVTKDFVGIRQRIRELEIEIDLTTTKINDERQEVRKMLEQQGLFSLKDIKKSEDTILNVPALFAQHRQVFSSVELDGIKVLYQQPDLDQEGESFEPVYPTNPNIYDFTDHFSIFNYWWFKRVGLEYEKIRDCFTYDSEAGNEAVAGSLLEFEKDRNKLPQSLLSPCQAYLSTVKSIIPLPQVLEAKVRKVKEDVEKVESNIFEESEPE